MTTLTFNPPTPGPDAEADVLASVLRDDGVIELWEAHFQHGAWWSSNSTMITSPVVSWAHKPAGVDMRGGVAQPAQAGEIAAWAQDEQFALAISDGAHIATTVTIYKERQPRFANTALYTTPPASQEQATDATILRYFAPWLPHPANDDDKQDLIKSARACFAKAPCGCRVGECESKADAHCRMTDEVHHQASQEPSGGEVVKPLFAASVAARKWAELQADGHRMQSIAFDGGKGGPGTITPWGKVMWGADFEIEEDSDQPVFDEVKGFRLAWGRGWWNSLTDDGDEARLEAACNIDIEWHTIGVVAILNDKDLIHNTERFREPFADHGGDKQKARRYAGTRAAAAMGGE